MDGRGEECVSVVVVVGQTLMALFLWQQKLPDPNTVTGL